MFYSLYFFFGLVNNNTISIARLSINEDVIFSEIYPDI